MTICLSHICRHAVDLARGQHILLSPEESEMLNVIKELGYLRYIPDESGDGLLCTCTHPALFEFYFYYSWLPEHYHLFKPQELPGGPATLGKVMETS